MACEMLDRLVDKKSRLLASTLLTEQRNESSLAGGRALTRPLARRCFVAAMVDQIVGDLKCQPDVPRIAAIGCARVTVQLGRDARRLNRISDARARFQLLAP